MEEPDPKHLTMTQHRRRCVCGLDAQPVFIYGDRAMGEGNLGMAVNRGKNAAFIPSRQGLILGHAPISTLLPPSFHATPSSEDDLSTSPSTVDPLVNHFSILTSDASSPAIPFASGPGGALPSQEFEPVVDVAALGTFVVIMGVSLWLIRRTGAVEDAVQEREEALTLVRDLKAKELSEGGKATISEISDDVRGDGDSESTPNAKLTAALQRYEAAVQTEERLRNIVPGVVRIVPPSAGNASEENARVAAKQFLGKDYDIGVPKREVANPSGNLPMISLGILAVLGISLTGLLVFLSLDPMAATSVMDQL